MSAPGTCSNCGEPHGPDDVFCESCGYDFLAGSLPEGQESPSVAGAAHAAEAAGMTVPGVGEADGAGGPTPATPDPSPAPEAAAILAVVTIDASMEFFERMSAGGTVTFPDPPPDRFTVELRSDNALIGRHSDSRGVYPEIDLTDSADPAASTRHAMLRHRPDGGWTITDVGSTNGTYLDDATDALAEGVETDLVDGTVIYVGAWTRIIVTPASA